MQAHGVSSIGYWMLAVALVVFGFAGIFSIGAPFFLTGAMLLALGPVRSRREVLWPALGGVWAFFLGYVLTAPLGCTSMETARTTGDSFRVGSTTCTNVIGIRYAGTGTYSPPLLPAVVAGVVLALVIGFALRRVLTCRPRPSLPS